MNFTLSLLAGTLVGGVLGLVIAHGPVVWAESRHRYVTDGGKVWRVYCMICGERRWWWHRHKPDEETA